MNIRKKIDEIFDEIVGIRRELHANPELSEKEIKTSQLISEFLSKNDIEYEKNIAGHGIIGIVRGKKDIKKGQRFRTIGIRADMDALPIEEDVNVPFRSKNKGVMHACGHDIHTAILLGTAKILKELEAEISGNIKFFFEPAEETIGGAKQMIAAGCLKNPDVDVVIGLHISPELEVGKIEFCRGKMNAASTEFEVSIQGVECHGAHPEKGVDTIVVASNLICSLQSIVTRNLSPTNPGVVTVGQVHGGKKNNVVAKETIISGIIRALDNETRAFIKKRVQEMSKNIALAYGADAKVIFIDSYPALTNDEELGTILENIAEKILSKQQVTFSSEPSLGADDFSYFSKAVKAVYFNIGCLGKYETKKQVLHSGNLNPNEECLRTGMLVEVFGALDILKQY